MIKTETIYNAKRFKNIREILVNAVENYPDNTAFIIKQKNKKIAFDVGGGLLSSLSIISCNFF